MKITFLFSFSLCDIGAINITAFHHWISDVQDKLPLSDFFSQCYIPTRSEYRAERLITEADATSAGFSGLVVAVAPTLASEQQNDAVAKTMLTNAPPSWSNNDLIAHNASNSGLINTAGSIVKGGLATGAWSPPRPCSR